jgi:hypothetical protein
VRGVLQPLERALDLELDHEHGRQGTAGLRQATCADLL